MNVANRVPPAKGTFRCRVCKKQGQKKAANQKIHSGACFRQAKLLRDRERLEKAKAAR